MARSTNIETSKQPIFRFATWFCEASICHGDDWTKLIIHSNYYLVLIYKHMNVKSFVCKQNFRKKMKCPLLSPFKTNVVCLCMCSARCLDDWFEALWDSKQKQTSVKLSKSKWWNNEYDIYFRFKQTITESKFTRVTFNYI